MNGFEIAIIGMSARFPEADDTNQFWENLVQGKESIKFLTPEEIDAINDPQFTSNPQYVNSRGGVLNDTGYFDASFFGYTPKEAEIMDPQFRLFHECAYTALDDAGYSREAYDGLIGIYGGASGNFQWQRKLADSNKYATRSGLAAIQYLERDFLTTLVSYNLNLKGPSFTVNTACSSSLVAVHLASQALLNGECDIALAGGVSLALDTEKGYLYQDGSILSPDGHCRAFDADAKGAIYGSGVGIVVLKLLEQAIENCDNIYAVIKGSAINNDGKTKVGFTAPSVQGQMEVISMAHRIAEVDSSQIGYIEAHGTGTTLGDPIEVEALKLAFNTSKVNYCALGSVKANIGHLDAAAGVAGLIKTSLILKYGLIPPVANFKAPNVKIDFDNSPFYINKVQQKWVSEYPRMAGVSSFGIGGTNAHLVLEQAPTIHSSNSDRKSHILPFSAKTVQSARGWIEKFAEYYSSSTEKIEDIAYTLITGRRQFAARGFIVANANLTDSRKIEIQKVLINDGNIGPVKNLTVFMFPGQGAQYSNMCFDLYDTDPFFRQELSGCFSIYNAQTGLNLEELIFPGNNNSVSKEINQTAVTQPLLFIFEYCLAKYLLNLGIQPGLMIGHSIGEYTAACIAGVFTFSEGLQLVTQRGALVQSLPPGAMLSVQLPYNEIKPYLSNVISLAAINSSSQCVVSGPAHEIAGLQQKLSESNIPVVLLETSHAFHSAMMDGALDKFAKCFATISLNPPQIPIVSNLTGTPVAQDDMTSAVYWVNHLRQTVQFSGGLDYILSKENVILIEVGPGNSLSNFVNKHQSNKSHHTISTVRHQRQHTQDDKYFLEALGKLWLAGTNIDFEKLYTTESRKKLSIPPYVFEKSRVNVVSSSKEQPETQIAAPFNEKNKLVNWFYNQVWCQNQLPFDESDQHLIDREKNWIIFSDPTFPFTFYNDLSNVRIITRGEKYVKKDSGNYVINPLENIDFQKLALEIEKDGWKDIEVVHTWSLCKPTDEKLNVKRYEDALNRSFFCLIRLIKAIGNTGRRIDLTIITNNISEITGNDLLFPELATLIGLVKILPLEYRNVTCRIIDISHEQLQENEIGMANDKIAAIIGRKEKSFITALRGNYEWLPEIRPVSINKANERIISSDSEKTFLILGLGGIAVHIAHYLTNEIGANVYMMHRSPFPPENEWQKTIETSTDDQLIKKINILQDIITEKKGKISLLHCDITDFESMQQHVEQIEKEHGAIYGVINAAGNIDDGGMILRRSDESIYNKMRSKIIGAIHIEQLFAPRNLELFILFSSLGTELYEEKFGEIAYSASNEFTDAYCFYNSGIKKKMVINWCDWQEIGMSLKAMSALFTDPDMLKKEMQSFNEVAISPNDGAEIFARAYGSNLKRLIIYPYNLPERLKQRDTTLLNYGKFLEEKFSLLTQADKNKVPEFASNEGIEVSITNIWKEYLGHNEIKTSDNIFELGASSLDVVKINNIIKSGLGIDVSVTTLFEYPTIHSFVNFLKRTDMGLADEKKAERINKGLVNLAKLKGINKH